MIRFGDYCNSEISLHERFFITPLKFQISIIVACPGGTTQDEIEEFAENINHDTGLVELIFVIDQPSSLTLVNEQLNSTESYRIVVSTKPCGMLSVLYDIGILQSRGNWIWLIDLRAELKIRFIEKVIQTSVTNRPNHIPVFINYEDDVFIAPKSGDNPQWLDLIYKGLQIPFVNLLFPRKIFSEHGLIDPSIAIINNYEVDFLLRICRSSFLEKKVVMDAPGIITQNSRDTFFFHWVDIDRSSKLHPDFITAFGIDDLSQFQDQLPQELVQKAYINKIIPYHNRYRHVLNGMVPISLQSLASSRWKVLLLKNDYETATDVVFRNFDRFSQGKRTFKLSYIQNNELASQGRNTDDAIVLFRTASYDCLEFAQEAIKESKPVAYALDDDLLHFYELGEGFSAFRPGHPSYDTMVESMKMADVVICGNKHVENAVRVHNSRTVEFDGSMLPEYLTKAGWKPRGSVFKFGYAGGGYRAKELNFIWPAIERICQDYGKNVCFEFWGIDPKALPENLPQVSCKPFTTNYYDYLNNLAASGFDAMLVPHFLEPSPRKGKNPNKVYDSAVAGAIGIYSNVPTYSVVEKYDIGILVDENSNAWFEAMRAAIEMPPDEFEDLRNRAHAFVSEHFATPAMIPKHESSLSALLFHGATREFRGENGKPVEMFVFPVIGGTGGGEITLRRRMEAAMKAGIQPMVVIPEWVTYTPDIKKFEDYLRRIALTYEVALFRAFVITPNPGDNLLPLVQEEDSFRNLFLQHPVALVHSAGYIPALGKVCSEMGIPHISSNYGIDDRFEWPMGLLPFQYCDVVHSDSLRYATKWGSLFNSHWAVLRDIAPESLFQAGFKRLYTQIQKTSEIVTLGMIGTLMRRKCNKEAIQATIQLIEEGYPIRLILHGAHSADVDYVNECKKLIEEHHCEDQIIFSTGYVDSLEDIYNKLDIVMTVSTHESLPNVIKEGAASGVMLLCSHAGGIDELILDNVNGIMVNDSSVQSIVDGLKRAILLKPDEKLWVRKNAYHLACQEFHPRKGLADLLALYNLVLYSKDSSRQNNPPLVSETRQVARKLESVLFNPEKWINDHAPYLPSSTRRIGRKIRYPFVAKYDRWSQLAIYIGTHQKRAAGKLHMRVLSSNGQLLRDCSIDLDQVIDNSWVSFAFGSIINSAQQSFQLEFELKKRDVGTQISFYEGNVRVSKLEKLVRRAFALFGFNGNGQKLIYRANYEKN